MTVEEFLLQQSSCKTREVALTGFLSVNDGRGQAFIQGETGASLSIDAVDFESQIEMIDMSPEDACMHPVTLHGIMTRNEHGEWRITSVRTVEDYLYSSYSMILRCDGKEPQLPKGIAVTECLRNNPLERAGC